MEDPVTEEVRKTAMDINETRILNTDKLCPASENCGGCLYQGVPYAEQYRQKDKAVRRLLAKHDIDEEVYLGMEPAICTGSYRNKMEYTFGDLEKGGELELGMHFRGRFMSILTTDECQLVPASFNTILRSVLEFCRLRGYRPYHRKTHEGLLRNLVLRCGVRTGEILVNIVSSSSMEFDEEGFKELLLGLDLDMEVVGILHTFNDSVADAVIDESHKILYGRDYYNEEILGLKFKVKAFAFFQTNIDAVERLYSDVLKVVPDVSGKTVYDLYCGTGTITQVLAPAARTVIGVEIVPEAVEDAIENAKMNGLSNVRFICGDVLDVIDRIEEKPDLIVLDPPREGIHPKALQKILNFGVKRIVYISCKLTSLVRDIEVFQQAGYCLERASAIDMFVGTVNIETVAVLTKARDKRVRS